jgi:hypothetical protein
MERLGTVVLCTSCARNFVLSNKAVRSTPARPAALDPGWDLPEFACLTAALLLLFLQAVLHTLRAVGEEFSGEDTWPMLGCCWLSGYVLLAFTGTFAGLASDGRTTGARLRLAVYFLVIWAPCLLYVIYSAVSRLAGFAR